MRRSRRAGSAFVLLAVSLSVRPAEASDHRFRISVGGGAALGTVGWNATSTWEEYQETAELEADYEAGLGPALEVGLGVRVSPRFGLRVAVSWSRRDTEAGVRARVPHPFFFDRPRGVEATVSGLEYRQLASHFDLEWRPLVGRVELAVFGGMCLARVEADLVNRVEYDEEYPYDEVVFRAAVTARARSDAGVGWSAGAELSYALGRRLALGIEARYTRARVELAPSAGDATTLDAGGLHLMATLSLGI